MRSVAFLTVVALALAVIANCGNPDETVTETTFVEASVEDADNQAVFDSIVDLRAYSELAYDKAVNLKAGGASGNTGLVNFIIDFAEAGVKARDKLLQMSDKEKEERKTKDGLVNSQVMNGLLEGVEVIPDIPIELPASAMAGIAAEASLKHYNVVVDFMKAMQKAKKSNSMGVGAYLISGLEQAIVQGKPVIDKIADSSYGANIVGYDIKAVGLKTMPTYFKKLGVASTQFLGRKAQVASESQGADAMAAAAFLKNAEEGQFKSFIQQEQDKTKEKVKNYKDTVEEAALKAIQTEFESNSDLSSLGKSGIEAANQQPDLEIRTADQIKADAEQAAEEWASKPENKPTIETLVDEPTQ